MLAQHGKFLGSQLPPLAGLQRLELQRSHAHAAQLLDRVPEGRQHVANVAVAALAQLHVEERATGVALQDHQLAAGARALARLLAGHEDAALQALDVLVVDAAVHHHFVALGHLEARVREAVGECAVVGHEEEARALGVEASHREEPRVRRMLHQVHRERPPLGVAVGAQVALGLEEHHVDVALGRLDAAAIHADVVLGGIHPRR